jgi:hypothetical protein
MLSDVQARHIFKHCTPNGVRSCYSTASYKHDTPSGVSVSWLEHLEKVK